MRTAIRVVALFVLAGASPAVADELPTSPSGGQPPEFEIVFTDGSRVRVLLLETALGFATPYGKLTVPATEVKRLATGFRYPDGVEARVETAVGKLGSPSFRDREEAEKALLGLKEYSLAALRRATGGADPEQVRRAESVLARLTATLPEDRLDPKEHDTVTTAAFTFRGRLEQPTLRVRSRQFGEASLKLDQIRSLRSLFVGTASSDLTLDAAKYARQGWTTWLDTGVDVSSEARLEITATGMIDQWVQTPGQYMAGPNGTGAAAPGSPPAGVVRGKPAPPAGPAPGRQWLSGAVVGKIGTNGAPFPVGANYREAKAPAGGRLYLIIAPSNWNNDSVGSYRVRIKVGE